MSYNIRSIDKVTIASKKYFFDANLWIINLKPPIDLTAKQKKYLDFVEKFKSHSSNPKIVVTALLLSEVINRYLKDVSYAKFCTKNNVISPDKRHYKSVYRISKEFKSDYASLCDDITAFSSIYELINDDLGTKISQNDILDNPPNSLDFNDLYYFLLAKQNNYTIVTDDSDFFVEDVDIITYNSQLIDKANSTLIKKI